MTLRRFIILAAVPAIALLGACQPAAQPSASQPQATEPPKAAAAVSESGPQLFILSNSSPHVTVIDVATQEIVKTQDLPNFTSWTWNDDNNYFDGVNLWLGMKDPDTTDVEVVALNLDTLEFTARLPIGKDKLTLYIGKATGDGILHVGKMDSGEVVPIDTKKFEIIDTWRVPVNGDVVCDADIATGPDGVERFYYPTRNGDTLVSIDPKTGETIKIVETPEGSTPFMLTTAPNATVWVQERGSQTNAVFDPVSLDLITRFPTGKVPIVASFSPDGKYGFIGHGGDTFVSVIDTETYEEIQRVEIGTNPQKVAVHPDGSRFYAILTKEASVAVVDTATWEVTGRIDLGTNPTGIFLRG